MHSDHGYLEMLENPLCSALRVQTLTSVKHVNILKLLSSQAVTVTRLSADDYELTHYLRNIISFDCRYGFNRLQSIIKTTTSFFHWFWWLGRNAVFTYAGPLNSVSLAACKPSPLCSIVKSTVSYNYDQKLCILSYFYYYKVIQMTYSNIRQNGSRQWPPDLMDNDAHWQHICHVNFLIFKHLQYFHIPY